jgi:hypothetical protein
MAPILPSTQNSVKSVRATSPKLCGFSQKLLEPIPFHKFADFWEPVETRCFVADSFKSVWIVRLRSFHRGLQGWESPFRSRNYGSGTLLLEVSGWLRHQLGKTVQIVCGATGHEQPVHLLQPTQLDLT